MWKKILWVCAGYSENIFELFICACNSFEPDPKKQSKEKYFLLLFVIISNI